MALPPPSYSSISAFFYQTRAIETHKFTQLNHIRIETCKTFTLRGAVGFFILLDYNLLVFVKL